jgi:GIY-YIG catalytic domain
MPIQNIKYNNTLIYKIVCNDLNIKDVYVGHTTDFRRRKNCHKSNCFKIEKNNKLYETINNNGGWENWSMIEIEKYPCNDANEARARERYWLEMFNACLNSNKPISSKQEYYNENKEKIQIYKKQYAELNKEIIQEKKRVYTINSKEKRKEYLRKYNDENKEFIREQQHQKYLRMKAKKLTENNLRIS